MNNQVQICALRSGSSGNAVYAGLDQTHLLIDAGVCGKAIEQSLADLDVDPRQLKALFVTHEHSDHISGVGVMMRRYKLPLYITEKTWAAMQHRAGKVDPQLIHFIQPDIPTTIGDFSVTAFSTPHDASDPVGYRVETARGSFSLITDLGHLSDDLIKQVSCSKAVMIEANYDEAMLMAGHYPYILKKRISSQVGHLSNDACAEAIITLLKQGTEYFQLAHLSKDNNYPDLALLTVTQALEHAGALIGRDVAVDVAKRYATSKPWFF